MDARSVALMPCTPAGGRPLPCSERGCPGSGRSTRGDGLLTVAASLGGATEKHTGREV